MRRTANGLSFSATDLSRFFESEFASWMDRYQRFHSDEPLHPQPHRNPEDPLLDLLSEKGNAHEASVIQTLEASVKVQKLAKNGSHDSDYEETVRAMRAGAGCLYQAALRSSNLFGYADILEKRIGTSVLGNHYYVPVDVKISATAKPTAILQLCAYAEMLWKMQGRLPEEIAVITCDSARHTFRTKDYFYFYAKFRDYFLSSHQQYTTASRPLPEKNADHRDWSIYAKKVLHDCDDVALAARIRSSQIDTLRATGITTLTQLAQCSQHTFKGITEADVERLKSQAQLQVQSKGKRPPLYKVCPHPAAKRMGLAMLPASHAADIFFDMEGYPLLGKHGLEYLYGVAERGSAKNYREFWAHTPEQEGTTFKAFMAWAFDRWQRNPGMHIYHYAPYEPSTLKRLMGTYGTCEAMMDELLRNEVFVDLYAVIKQGLQVGTYSYGLKAIETLYYPERETEVSSGAESAVQFAHWLAAGDFAHPETSLFLERIRKYNQDDCWSTQDLEAFLQAVKAWEQIAYVPRAPRKEKETKIRDKESAKDRCSRLAHELLATVSLEKRGLPQESASPEDYVCELLAHSLEFNQREEKPDWWSYFERLKMSAEDMVEDPETLVGVKVENRTDDTFSCSFPVDQESKFNLGTSVLILENDSPYEALEITSWDPVTGKLVLTGEPSAIPDGAFTLAPAGVHFNKDALFTALSRLSESFNRKLPYLGLRKAIHDLLLRKSPDIAGCKTNAPLIPKGKLDLDKVTTAISNLNESTLCIQGPPGTGKTYTASRVIAQLLKSGKTVAVSSNSHKAINQLLFRVDEVCGRDREVCRPLKVTSGTYYEEESVEFSPRDIILEKTPVKPDKIFGSAKRPLFPEGPTNLLGATVYFLSKEDMQDRFDYLFVDEATQVALPNLLAMGSCAKNIVLLGDQMQLEQPSKAVHPGDSGKSALGHLTGGKPTVAPEFGIFLPTSYRMHPKLCSVISSCFYDGSLGSEPATSAHEIVWNHKTKGEIQTNGIQFIPVEHTGNKHGSIEEVREIRTLVATALKSKWTDKDGKQRKIGPEDILIVAPYNYQVALLKSELEGQAQIGSVDRFQGLEAPIVILSLCASSASEAPRGLRFLLNKNRLNVALSRAKCLALVVGSPSVGEAAASSLQSMELLNLFHRLTSVDEAIELEASDKTRVA